jgi:tetratricopeptide (TPR) repeat protein
MNEEPKNSRQTPPLSQKAGVETPAERLFAVRAEALRVQNRLAEAVEVLKEGLEKNPDYLPARLLLGRCYWEREMPAEAKIELEKVSAVIEECLPVYKFLSKVYVHERRDVDKALEAVRRALYFTSQEVSKKKATAAEMDLDASAGRRPPASSGPEPAAGEPREEALEARIKTARLAIQTDTLAEIFIKQGKPEKALAIYGKILNEDPQNEAVRQKFEALQKKVGRKSESAAREKMIATLEKWLEKAGPEKGK